jgi:heme exporter protein A
MNNSLLSVNQLACYRGERLLFDALCFQLNAGELLQITGANGSGKTTLLRLLTGLYPLQKGDIRWCGKTIYANREAYQQQMYYLGHSLGVKHELTVLENLQLNWRKPMRIMNQVDVVLTKLDLIHYKNELCRHLSRGQRQRLALAQLMLSDALLWILDEPFASLDQVATTLLQQIFVEKLQTQGAILFTSHQPLTLTTLQPKIVAIAAQA